MGPGREGSRRALFAIGAQGAASGSVLLLSIAIARSGGAERLGEYAVIYAAFLLLRGAAQELTLTPLLSRKLSLTEFRAHTEQQSLIGVGLGIIALIVGLIFQSEMLIVLGVSFHGLLLLSYSKVVNVTVGKGSIAVVQELAVVVAVGSALFGTIVWQWGAVAAFATWALASSAAGYITSLVQRYSLKPKLRATKAEGSVGASFAVQSLIGSGSVNLLTMLMAIVAGPAVVGILRGGSTILGPANMTVVAIQPIVLRSISQTLTWEPRRRFLYLCRHSLKVVAFYTSVASVMVIASHYWGGLLLGSVWPQVQPILLIMLFDGLLAAITQVATLFHRASWNHRRAMRLSFAVLVFRFPVVLFGASAFGVLGATVGLAASSVMSAVTWWLSVADLNRTNRIKNIG